jgi:hypothetical protein
LRADEGKALRTRDDVEAAIGAFSEADWARLQRLGAASTFKTGWGSEDLLQEAILRTLQGTRNCPTDVDVIKHLIDTMSSIANGERDKARNQFPHLPTLQPGVSGAVDLASSAWSAEEKLVYEGGRVEIVTLFDDDPVAKELAEGIIAGFETAQLKELTGLQGTAYNTKRTLIRRRLLKFSPNRRPS